MYDAGGSYLVLGAAKWILPSPGPTAMDERWSARARFHGGAAFGPAGPWARKKRCNSTHVLCVPPPGAGWIHTQWRRAPWPRIAPRLYAPTIDPNQLQSAPSHQHAHRLLMATIAILFHQRTRNPEGYKVHYLTEFWRAAGHQVVYLFGTRRFIPADILLIHVDLSVVPPNYLHFADRYPVVINRHLTDIRKSTVSRSLLASNDEWCGAVIVKTNLNYGGYPERALAPLPVRLPVRLFRGAATRASQLFGLPFLRSPTLTYAVFSSLPEVPTALWSRRDLVIEKFCPEMEDGLFHVRTHQVLGDRWTSTRLASKEPIVKARNSMFENIPPHPIVDRWRKDLNVDYGKLDYVVVDEQPILLDVNKTMGLLARDDTSESVRSSRRHLAEGLDVFLNQ